MAERCEFEREGKRCKGYKVTGSKYCFTHSDDPETVALRQEALREAGQSNKLYFPLKEGAEVGLRLPTFVDLSKAKGIKRAYITIIKAAAANAIDEKRLGALTYALNGYVNAIDKIEILERIETLEKKAREQGGYDE